MNNKKKIPFTSTAAVIGFERSLYEVDEEDGSVTVAVRVLEGTLANDVEVLLTTTDGTATSSGETETHNKTEFVENAKFLPPDPIDYTSTTTTLTFGPSITRQEVAIPITDDDVVESIEDFFATISLQTGGANVLIAPSSTQVRIDDDDGELYSAQSVTCNLFFLHCSVHSII